MNGATPERRPTSPRLDEVAPQLDDGAAQHRVRLARVAALGQRVTGAQRSPQHVRHLQQRQLWGQDVKENSLFYSL